MLKTLYRWFQLVGLYPVSFSSVPMISEGGPSLYLWFQRVVARWVFHPEGLYRGFQWVGLNTDGLRRSERAFSFYYFLRFCFFNPVCIQSPDKGYNISVIPFRV
jgi:hypothetical protein